MVEEVPRVSFQSTEACRAVVNPLLWFSLQVPFFPFFLFLPSKKKEGGGKRKKKENPWFKLAIAPSFWLWATLSCAKYTVSSSSPTTNQSRHTKAVKKEWWRKILDSPPPPPSAFSFCFPPQASFPSNDLLLASTLKWYWDLQPATLLTASLEQRHLCLSVLTEHCKGEVIFYYSSQFYLIADVWKKNGSWISRVADSLLLETLSILAANSHHCIVAQLTKTTFPNTHLKRFDIVCLYSKLLKKKKKKLEKD